MSFDWGHPDPVNAKTSVRHGTSPSSAFRFAAFVQTGPLHARRHMTVISPCHLGFRPPLWKSEGFFDFTLSEVFPMTKTRTDVYTRITNRIVEQLQPGVRPWHKPWNAEHAAGRITRPLRHNGKPYNGINILMLWDSAEQQGFACPIWLTFKQVKELNGYVCKGERSSQVVYASSFTKKDKDDNGEESQRGIPFLKQYNVFNAEQCEGFCRITSIN